MIPWVIDGSLQLQQEEIVCGSKWVPTELAHAQFAGDGTVLKMTVDQRDISNLTWHKIEIVYQMNIFI